MEEALKLLGLGPFLKGEDQTYRSPVHVAFVLIKALRQYETKGDSSLFESAFVRQNKYQTLTRNYVLTRAIASVGARVGSPIPEPRMRCLGCVEPGDILIRCISKAHGKILGDE